MNHIIAAENLARVMDKRFSVGGVRFGLDPILSMLPVGGSTVGLILSSYILWIAYKEGVPLEMRRKMAFNVAGDFIVGAIPFVGWIGDVFIRANIKNAKMLREYLDQRSVDVEAT